MRKLLRAAREAALTTALIIGAMAAFAMAAAAMGTLFAALYGEALFPLGGFLGLAVAIFVAAIATIWWQERQEPR